jgi:hypothetical protein
MTATTTALQPWPGALAPGVEFPRLPALPWRDPHSVPPEKLAEVIASLKEACALNPANADLRVCLGIAYAMNYDVYSSLDALEEARALEPRNFFAQFKFAELQYRLRALHVAETETLQALELASNPWELAHARHQLSEIRRLTREGTIKPTWAKTLVIPVICFGLILTIVTVLFTVIR